MGSLLACGAFGLLGGCVDNTISVYIQQVTLPQNMGTTCTLTPDPTMPGITEGTLDLALTDHYVLRPIIRSEFIARRDPMSFRPESNAVAIDGFVVEIHEGSPDGPPIGPPFTVYQSLLIEPGTSGAPGFGVTSVQVIPPAITNMIKSDVCRVDTRPGRAPSANCPRPFLLEHQRRLIVRVVGFGKTTGQVDVQTPPFDFPVNVRCNYLVQYSTDSVVSPVGSMGGTGHNSPNCLNGTAVTSIAACEDELGQDVFVDCRLCSGNNVICQPPGFNPDPTAPITVCPTQ